MRSFSLLAATFLVLVQCSSGADPKGFGDESSEGASSGSVVNIGGDRNEAGTSTATCSSDLHQVLDKDGALIKTCPADLGCANGACVPACESARANRTTIGCDYYAVAPDAIPESEGGCFAAFIANTWGTPVTLSADRGGVPLNIATMARIPSGSGKSIVYKPLVGNELPPGQVAILFLSRFGEAPSACPIAPGFTNELASISGTGLGLGFHLVASAPVVAYDIYPYGGGSSAVTSATLLLPTTAWDLNYIGVNAYRKSLISYAKPSLAIIAEEDGTSVTIRPTAAIEPGTGVAGTASGVPATYALKRGQVLQFSQAAELTGSVIQSTKPIGVFGGASCLSIDPSTSYCDVAHQQLPPVRALGSEYVGVRYRNRFDGVEESPPWRIVGAVDGTTLSYSPKAPAGAPLSLKLGQVAEFNSAGGFVVKSQDEAHPFYVSAHMTGCEGARQTAGADKNDCRGDPEFVNVIPASQWLRSYVFFTDPTYPETNLVVTRPKTASGFKDVELDCAGKLTGWQPLGADYEYTRIDLVRGNFQRQGSCDNGRHEMKSEAPFALTVWAWGSSATNDFQSTAVSYAYPAGASVKPVNGVVVPAIPK
jgi:IgGFc binding protein